VRGALAGGSSVGDPEGEGGRGQQQGGDGSAQGKEGWLRPGLLVSLGWPATPCWLAARQAPCCAAQPATSPPPPTCPAGQGPGQGGGRGLRRPGPRPAVAPGAGAGGAKGRPRPPPARPLLGCWAAPQHVSMGPCRTGWSPGRAQSPTHEEARCIVRRQRPERAESWARADLHVCVCTPRASPACSGRWPRSPTAPLSAPTPRPPHRASTSS
jgi:hypothetical protein